jgi:hypothetical protein
MKIKLVISDSKKGKIEIPITRKEINDVYDASYMIDNDSWRTIKLNKCDKSWISFRKKIEHIIHDVLGDGKTYSMKKDKKNKVKFVLNKKKHYMVKKPKWKK